MKNNTLTALSGVKVGNSTDIENLTGCTVAVFNTPLPVAYKSFGGSTGTYNIDVFGNGKSDYRADGIFISGGSWNGLQSGAEISKALIEKKIGRRQYKIFNPNVVGAVVFDLGVRIRQYDSIGGKIAVESLSNRPVVSGNIGAGTGCSVGKFQFYNKGNTFAGMKAGLGSARIDLPGGIIIAALSVVNAVGNIVLPDGSFLAGNRHHKDQETIVDFRNSHFKPSSSNSNTTITILGTNLDLKSRENYERFAHLASHGQVRAICPINTAVDGDTVFVFSTEKVKNFKMGSNSRKWNDCITDYIGTLGADVVQQSIYDACIKSETIKLKGALNGIVPNCHHYKK